jgi:hypothetical protein
LSMFLFVILRNDCFTSTLNMFHFNVLCNSKARRKFCNQLQTQNYLNIDIPYKNVSILEYLPTISMLVHHQPLFSPLRYSPLRGTLSNGIYQLISILMRNVHKKYSLTLLDQVLNQHRFGPV